MEVEHNQNTALAGLRDEDVQHLEQGLWAFDLEQHRQCQSIDQ